MTLNPIERRVLGVLLEKSMTQPEYYPMTANAIVAGCNQKSNRDPVMDLDDVAVDATLTDLRKRGLIEQLFPAPGARTDRFRHKIEAVFGWGSRERAIMTELLLRGPQTTGELRTRCARMVTFETLETVTNVLDTLSHLDPPMVVPLPREPGRSAVRYTHLLYPEDEVTQTHTPTTAPPVSPPPSPPPHPALPTSDDPLRTEVTALRQEIADLRQRLETLESRFAG